MAGDKKEESENKQLLLNKKRVSNIQEMNISTVQLYIRQRLSDLHFFNNEDEGHGKIISTVALLNVLNRATVASLTLQVKFKLDEAFQLLF